MRRATLALVTALTASGCATPRADRAPADATPGVDPVERGAPRGGSSPVPVLAGVVIGVGLVALLLSDEGAGGGAAFLPPG